MEVHKTKDNTVFKFVHEDRSETAIKDVGGCSGLGADATEKYSVFASCSYGCIQNCKFCLLHTKGCRYRYLDTYDIEDNLYAALEAAVKERPSLTQKKVKLAWMGMGEPLKITATLLAVTTSVIRTVFREKWATGLDCVDIGTSFPDCGFNTLPMYLLDILSKDIKAIPELRNEVGRSRPLVRLFVSVGALDEEKRVFLMGKEGKNFKNRLDFVRANYEVPNSLICHLLLFEGVNDSDEDVEGFLKFFGDRPDLELRLLRYNQCSGSGFTESKKFDEVAERFLKELPRVKVQMSPGSEVMAACGQFLV